ncbi:uroporphyrinogen-III C-methyltransferase [Ferroglobus placidus DSM 10642]|uniref:Uroporphyrinogen-III C-methyltransferase n=1 Tax=Ferroglobus placidus (strain DSM 10642 / AEDII12DO) TaxID=589924 RepID=D3S1K9_FERPA|nr:hypothetical protein [Ferroglobus placidus]ADC66473.1 uroporphyrinogen-III C-methyltransferase [Ferroglobus placidus DSM 10642]
MLRKRVVFGTVIFLAVLALLQPTSAVGVLKIEAPSSVVVGEEVEITAINALTGKPVAGVAAPIGGLMLKRMRN